MPHRQLRFIVAALVLSAVLGNVTHGQSAATVTLPDAPSFLLAAADASAVSSSADAFDGPQAAQPAVTPNGTPVYARRLATSIQPGMLAQPLSAGDKFEMSIVRRLTLGTLASSLFSAGYSHLLDNRPHYGTDSAGFGERLGAAQLRSTTQSIFNFGVYSNLFHDDPRYYVLGPQHSVKKRAIYAATRVLLTRKNDGNRAINYPYLAAVATSAALTNAYYPDRDRSVGRSVGGVFTTIGLQAGILQFSEFGGDIKRRIFHKHRTTP